MHLDRLTLMSDLLDDSHAKVLPVRRTLILILDGYIDNNTPIYHCGSQEKIEVANRLLRKFGTEDLRCNVQCSCGTHTGSPTLYVTQHREPMSNIRIIYARVRSLSQETHKKDANIILLNDLVASKGMVGLPVFRTH